MPFSSLLTHAESREDIQVCNPVDPGEAQRLINSFGNRERREATSFFYDD